MAEYQRTARRQRHVILFARAPEYGRVKSRLAKEIGALGAWRFYRDTAQSLRHRLGVDPTWTVWLALTGDARRGWPGKFHWLPQGSGTLAERMERAIRAMPPGEVVLLGSDIPGVRPSHIRRAFSKLSRAPIVFGPAKDGGFWLVGARRVPGIPQPLFPADVRWSSVETLTDVLTGLRVPYALADMMGDVDTAADLVRARQEGRL